LHRLIGGLGSTWGGEYMLNLHLLIHPVLIPHRLLLLKAD
jgi:hypothetical protein